MSVSKQNFLTKGPHQLVLQTHLNISSSLSQQRFYLLSYPVKRSGCAIKSANISTKDHFLMMKVGKTIFVRSIPYETRGGQWWNHAGPGSPLKHKQKISKMCKTTTNPTQVDLKDTLGKKNTIHQVTAMLVTSKNVLFPAHNHHAGPC